MTSITFKIIETHIQNFQVSNTYFTRNWSGSHWDTLYSLINLQNISGKFLTKLGNNIFSSNWFTFRGPGDWHRWNKKFGVWKYGKLFLSNYRFQLLHNPTEIDNKLGIFLLAVIKRPIIHPIMFDFTMVYSYSFIVWK